MFAKLERLCVKIAKRSLALNTAWLLIGQLITFCLQLVFFVELAKLLGVRDYGLLSGAFALSFTLMPYASLGGGMVYMRHVTGDRSLAQEYWGNYLLVTFLVSSLFVACVFLYGVFFRADHSRIALIFYAILANCLFNSIVSLASYVFQSQEKMKITALLTVSFNAIRLAVLLLFRYLFHTTSAFTWSIGATLAGAFASLFALLLVTREIGPPKVSAKLLGRRLWEGAGFSFAGTTQSVYNDFDKVLLTGYGMLVECGFYTLAYRAVDFAFTPIASLDLAVIPRYMKLGAERMREVIHLCGKALLASVGVGAATALVIMASEPVISLVFGSQYAGAQSALTWLCWIPLLRGIHRSAGSALTGTGRQHFRTIAQFLVAGGNTGANVLLIPRFGWKAACWTSVASDACLGALNCLILLWIWRSLKPAGKPAARPNEVCVG